MTDHFPDATKMVPEPFGYFRPEPFGWTDCAETDEGARPLFDVQAVHGLAVELEATERQVNILTDDLNKVYQAVKKLHAAKGRYHTQLAACDLFDLVGLPNERPKK